MRVCVGEGDVGVKRKSVFLMFFKKVNFVFTNQKSPLAGKTK